MTSRKDELENLKDDDPLVDSGRYEAKAIDVLRQSRPSNYVELEARQLAARGVPPREAYGISPRWLRDNDPRLKSEWLFDDQLEIPSDREVADTIISTIDIPKKRVTDAVEKLHETRRTEGFVGKAGGKVMREAIDELCRDLDVPTYDQHRKEHD